MTEYGYTIEVPAGYDEAVLRTRVAMRGEGFSILSEMHVGGMLGPQAGDARQYLILGVFNGVISERRLDADLRAAVHLPCNVVVQEVQEHAIVAALDPRDTVEGAAGVTETQIGAARDALARMLQRVASGVDA